MSLIVNPTNHSRAVVLNYTNYRGVRSMRVVIPQRMWFGSNEWHPEPQWLLEAFDVGKGAFRDFALASIHGVKAVERPESASVPADASDLTVIDDEVE